MSLNSRLESNRVKRRRRRTVAEASLCSARLFSFGTECIQATLEATQGQIFKSISHKCHPILVAFVWELTKETIYLPLGCLQSGERIGVDDGLEEQRRERSGDLGVRVAGFFWGSREEIEAREAGTSFQKIEARGAGTSFLFLRVLGFRFSYYLGHVRLGTYPIKTDYAPDPLFCMYSVRKEKRRFEVPRPCATRTRWGCTTWVLRLWSALTSRSVSAQQHMKFIGRPHLPYISVVKRRKQQMQMHRVISQRVIF